MGPDEVGIIAENAARKIEYPLHPPHALAEIKRFAGNGRDAVNILQIAAGVVLSEGRNRIDRADVEWVLNCGQYSPRSEMRIGKEPAVGVVNGLAVYGANQAR